jgi:Na+/H+ antiporter NhaD/arsenite permease-like protein
MSEVVVKLLALCFAITIGSVTTPIGNPQNLLLSNYADLEDAFTPFLLHLAVPTVINLFIAWLIVRFFYPPPEKGFINRPEEQVNDPYLARLAKLSLIIILILIGIRIVVGFTEWAPLPLMIIALATSYYSGLMTWSAALVDPS